MPTVSYSEIDTYRQCRYKHQLGYQQRWKPRETPMALGRGTLFHAVLEAHYGALIGSEGREPADRLEGARVAADAVLRAARRGESPHEDIVSWVYGGYADLYADDPQWEIISVERSVMEWLSTDRGTRSNIRFKGKCDLVVRWKGNYWVVDHKTCKNLPKGRDIDLDDQMGLYVWLLRRSGVPVQGAIYNACRTERLKTREMDPSERFKRVLSFRSDAELEEIAREVRELGREAHMKRSGDAPRSPDPERCGWKCGFTEACLHARKGGDAGQFLAETGFVQDFTRH